MSTKAHDRRMHFIGAAMTAGHDIHVANIWYSSLSQAKRQTWTDTKALMAEFEAWLPTAEKGE